MEVGWNLSMASHGESLEHVPQGFLISRGVEEKWTHYWVIFPQSTLTFLSLSVYMLPWEWRPSTDLHDYTLNYCTCHLFSLARGMFAMVTAHSGLAELTHAVLCISRLGSDEGKSLPVWSLTPDEVGFNFSSRSWKGPHVPLCSFSTPPSHPHKGHPTPKMNSYFLSQTVPDYLNCPFCPLRDNKCCSSEADQII